MKKANIPVRSKYPAALAHIAALINAVEHLVFKEGDETHCFISLPWSGRLVKTAAVKKALRRKWRPGGDNPDLCLFPSNFKSGLKWLQQWWRAQVELSCRADLILVRSNISLFYFDKGIRIKIQKENPDRDLGCIRNEVRQRLNIQDQTNHLHVPRIIRGRVAQPPFFFVDEIISGKVLSWTDPQTPEVFEGLIPILWRFYQSNGICWRTPRENNLELETISADYNQLQRATSDIRFPFDLKKIQSFQHRPAPCSTIHGDFAIHNIILAQNKIYLTDWELSAFGYIMSDFYKLLIIADWPLAKTVASLMASELHGYAAEHQEAPLSFSEQLYFILFLEAYKLLKTPHYPHRLLKRAQKEFTDFFQRAGYDKI